MARYATSTKHQRVLVLFNSDWSVKAYRLTPTKRPRSYNQEPRAQRREIIVFPLVALEPPMFCSP